VLDGNGNAVDCSQWSNLFTLACWTPTAPCAAAGSTPGAPATVDCSQSQLGTFLCELLEAPADQVSLLGIPLYMWALGVAGVVAWKVLA
jgi:hypothetical protein